MTLEVKHLLLPSPIGSHEQTLKLKPSEHPPPGHHAPLLVGYAWLETASDHRFRMAIPWHLLPSGQPSLGHLRRGHQAQDVEHLGNNRSATLPDFGWRFLGHLLGEIHWGTIIHVDHFSLCSLDINTDMHI